jgi:glyoxylase-like metal-dependent hydrolase (beta-lactamase superfamily II)
MLEQRDAAAGVLPASVELLVTGYPGKSSTHGGLGWSTIALVRHAGRIAVIDVGSFTARRSLLAGLAQRGLTPADVTDVLLTHAHHDHSVNWMVFPNATVCIGRAELSWAATHPEGQPMAELYVDAMLGDPRLRLVEDGETVLPDITARLARGHTPGSLCYLFDAGDREVIFTGDAAKNRAELRSGRVDLTIDAAASEETLRWIRSVWLRRPKNVVVPGHDLPMTLDAAGVPQYAGTRRASIEAWFGDTLDEMQAIDLCERG